MLELAPLSPLACSGGCGRLGVLGHGAQAEWGALSPHFPPAFSFRCTGSRTVHAAQQCPSSSPRSVKKSLSRAEWDPAAAPLGCLETRGGARRATGPGSSVLLCHFIGERWYGGVSTSAAAGGHTQPLGCPGGPGHWLLHPMVRNLEGDGWHSALQGREG